MPGKIFKYPKYSKSMPVQHETILEACVENQLQAIHAENQGAQRIELCSHLDLDGLTPHIDDVKQLLGRLNIPIKVMIRNRHGNFEYSRDDIKTMSQEIDRFSNLGIDQFVIGATRKNKIDLDVIRELVSVNDKGIYTFHKAIDLVNDPIESLNQLKSIPEIKYVLTSGQASTAIDGIECLKRMIHEAKPHIRIIVAGKVTRSSLPILGESLTTCDFHGKLIVGSL